MKINKQLNDTDATIQLFVNGATASKSQHNVDHHIQKITAHIAGQQVFEMNAGVALAHHPYVEINLSGRKQGEIVEIQWIDSLGDSGQDSVQL